MAVLTRALRTTLEALFGLLKLVALLGFCLWAYRIRLYAVDTYGYLIHEFDPWFNFRATQYLAKNGWSSFFQWYDHMSWYPLGRPIGTTIYPGMQIAAVWIWQAMKYLPKKTWNLKEHLQFGSAFLPKDWVRYLPGAGTLSVAPMSLNNVCVMFPAWFGSLATLFLALLTAETSGSSGAGVAASFVMAILPAHIFRSYAGEFENESFAMPMFCAVFWLWCRALRTPRSWPFGALAGVAYVGAVAAWGGYIFVNNLIGLHASVLVALGKYNSGLYRAYTLWYVLGTAGATFVPVVNWIPLKSLEQMPSLVVFLVFQVLEFCDAYRRRRGKMTTMRFFAFRAAVFAVAIGMAFVTCSILLKQSYFYPLTARIRGLFLKHVKTGNPLVDSVAEHSPGSDESYRQYLHDARYVAALGLLFCWHQDTPAKSFPVVYAVVAYYFSLKMSRLIVICAPIVSMLAGYPVGIVFDWCQDQLVGLLCGPRPVAHPKPAPCERSGGMGSILRGSWRMLRSVVLPGEVRDLASLPVRFQTRLPLLDRLLRSLVAVAIIIAVPRFMRRDVHNFIKHCDEIAEAVASPRIAFMATMNDGSRAIIDDYVAGYRWLKKNTPEDARVMAWWDYGYHITGVGNRTSIADGNTWNHEHIATLGRTLTSPEKKAHNVMRHLADYVLVWAGGRKDDIAKSRHLARIATSVFPDVCGEDDPVCSKFGMYKGGEPTPMMAASFLYRAVKHKLEKGVHLSKKLFAEVHTTKNGLMRIFKVLNVSEESKTWIADPKNRLCDAPGSWYCPGQYPPALQPLIARRKNFAQLEDFNKVGQEKSAYTKLVEEQMKSKGRVDL